MNIIIELRCFFLRVYGRNMFDKLCAHPCLSEGEPDKHSLCWSPMYLFKDQAMYGFIRIVSFQKDSKISSSLGRGNLDRVKNSSWMAKILLMFSSFEMCGFWIKTILSSTIFLIKCLSQLLIQHCVLSSLCCFVCCCLFAFSLESGSLILFLPILWAPHLPRQLPTTSNLLQWCHFELGAFAHPQNAQAGHHHVFLCFVTGILLF